MLRGPVIRECFTTTNDLVADLTHIRIRKQNKNIQCYPDSDKPNVLSIEDGELLLIGRRITDINGFHYDFSSLNGLVIENDVKNTESRYCFAGLSCSTTGKGKSTSDTVIYRLKSEIIAVQRFGSRSLNWEWDMVIPTNCFIEWSFPKNEKNRHGRHSLKFGLPKGKITPTNKPYNIKNIYNSYLNIINVIQKPFNEGGISDSFLRFDKGDKTNKERIYLTDIQKIALMEKKRVLAILSRVIEVLVRKRIIRVGEEIKTITESVKDKNIEDNMRREGSESYEKKWRTNTQELKNNELRFNSYSQSGTLDSNPYTVIDYDGYGYDYHSEDETDINKKEKKRGDHKDTIINIVEKKNYKDTSDSLLINEINIDDIKAIKYKDAYHGTTPLTEKELIERLKELGFFLYNDDPSRIFMDVDKKISNIKNNINIPIFDYFGYIQEVFFFFNELGFNGESYTLSKKEKKSVINFLDTTRNQIENGDSDSALITVFLRMCHIYLHIFTMDSSNIIDHSSSYDEKLYNAIMISLFNNGSDIDAKLRTELNTNSIKKYITLLFYDPTITAFIVRRFIDFKIWKKHIPDDIVFCIKRLLHRPDTDNNIMFGKEIPFGFSEKAANFINFIGSFSNISLSDFISRCIREKEDLYIFKICQYMYIYLTLDRDSIVKIIKRSGYDDKGKLIASKTEGKYFGHSIDVAPRMKHTINSTDDESSIEDSEPDSNYISKTHIDPDITMKPDFLLRMVNIDDPDSKTEIEKKEKDKKVLLISERLGLLGKGGNIVFQKMILDAIFWKETHILNTKGKKKDPRDQFYSPLKEKDGNFSIEYATRRKDYSKLSFSQTSDYIENRFILFDNYISRVFGVATTSKEAAGNPGKNVNALINMNIHPIFSPV